VKFYIHLLAVLLVANACADSVTTSSPLTVQVKPSNGVPQLFVNGVPTIPRLFYGGIGWEPIHVGPGDQKVSFDFVAVDSDSAAQISIHFDPPPGNLVLDDFQLTDLAGNSKVFPSTSVPDSSGEWLFSPANETNTSGSVQLMPGAGHDRSTQAQITLHAPQAGAWTETVLHTRTGIPLVKGHQYRVDFQAKSDVAQAISVVFYRSHMDMSDQYQIIGAGNEPLFREVQLAAKSGVNLVTCPLPVPWPKPGQPADTSFADAICDYILAANSHALIIPRININAPVWWIASHPDDEMQWKGVKKNKSRAATIASPVYRQEAEANLTAFINHLESKYGDHMAGYHIAGGNSNEWFYEDSHHLALQGYAPADLKNWQLWLAAHYKDDGALQQAWGNNAVTLATAEVPTPEQRQATTEGILFNPSTERMVVDWNQYQQDTMAGFVCELAHLTRQTTHGNKLVLFFYGYLFEFAALEMGPASSGHFDLRQVLDCPDIDALCSPISYYDRNTGGSAPSMSVPESVALAGKLWIMEDDISTHLSLTYINPPGAKDRTHSLDETLQDVLRNGSEVTLRNMGTWWMDLCRNGWFDDPALWSAFESFRPVETEMLKLKQPFHPEVAAVVDEKSMLLLTYHSYDVGQPLMESRSLLGRMGAPYGQYLEDDVRAGRVPDAKLYLFLTAWNLTAQERAQLRQQTRGKTCLWEYAAGYFDGDKPSLDAMHELTGFRVAKITPKSSLVTPTPEGERLGLKTPFGAPRSPNPLTPLFTVTDAQHDEILATFPDGSAAVVMRHSGDGVSIFSGTPALSVELLRLASDAAGVHLYTHTDAAIYANGPFLAIHGVTDGPLAIDTGRPGEIVDALTGQSLGQGPNIDLPIRKGQTRVLRY